MYQHVSEFLLQADHDRAPQSVLWRADADACAVAYYVGIVEQIYDVDPQLGATADRQLLGHREIERGVGGQSKAIRHVVDGIVCPQATAQEEVGGNPGGPLGTEIEGVG